MDPTTIIQWVIAQGGVAGFAIWMLVKAYQDKEALYIQNKADGERYALAYHEIILLLLIALDKGTEASTTLIGKLEALSTALAVTSRRQEEWQNERRATNPATPAP